MVLVPLRCIPKITMTRPYSGILPAPETYATVGDSAVMALTAGDDHQIQLPHAIAKPC
jgi:hypothetical protein